MGLKLLGGCIPKTGLQMAVGQNLRYLFGDDYPPKIVDFKGFLGVHRGYGVLTHCQIPNHQPVLHLSLKVLINYFMRLFVWFFQR